MPIPMSFLDWFNTKMQDMAAKEARKRLSDPFRDAKNQRLLGGPMTAAKKKGMEPQSNLNKVDHAPVNYTDSNGKYDKTEAEVKLAPISGDTTPLQEGGPSPPAGEQNGIEKGHQHERLSCADSQLDLDATSHNHAIVHPPKRPARTFSFATKAAYKWMTSGRPFFPAERTSQEPTREEILVSFLHDINYSFGDRHNWHHIQHFQRIMQDFYNRVDYHVEPHPNIWLNKGTFSGSDFAVAKGRLMFLLANRADFVIPKIDDFLNVVEAQRPRENFDCLCWSCRRGIVPRAHI